MMVIAVTLLASLLPAGAENPFRKLLSDEDYEKAKKGLKPRFEEWRPLNPSRTDAPIVIGTT